MFRFAILYLFVICFARYTRCASDGSTAPSTLTIFDNSAGTAKDYVNPCNILGIGPISWNNSQLFALRNNDLPQLRNGENDGSTPPTIIPILLNSDYGCCEDLENWNNPLVNVYLILWPKTLAHAETHFTTSVQPIEGNEKSFISRHNFRRMGIGNHLMFAIASRVHSPSRQRGGYHGMRHEKQIYKNYHQAHIFYNDRYMVICYNYPHFEITNLTELSGFLLTIGQRKALFNATIYSWDWNNQSITIFPSIDSDRSKSPFFTLKLNGPTCSTLSQSTQKGEADKVEPAAQNSPQNKPKRLLEKIVIYKKQLIYCFIGLICLVYIFKALLAK